VALEYAVERSRSTETVRPDLVLFVNGIPFCVIECKAPEVEISQAISQSIRNQSEEYIPKLFTTVQLVLVLNKNEAMYATVGTAAKFWGSWKEPKLGEDGQEFRELQRLVNQPISAELIAKAGRILHVDPFVWNGERLITEQDKTVYALCRPVRLLELAWKFTLFDGGIKKIARYQQYFVIKSTLDRVKHFDDQGSRLGGMIWHTQGSGKSLTMVMLARNLALDPEIIDPRIVLVTDRDDLDKQLGNTFAACGLGPSRATSGRNLLDLVTEAKAGIITTLVHKFEKAMNTKREVDDSANIFILVDESHRTQFGSFSAQMRMMFPRACYLGFSGTPLLKKHKNNFMKFGGLIEPHYSISQAVADKAVVPLLYEGRLVEMEQNKVAIDLWFERHTQGLTTEQKADLKRKYAKAELLNKADQVVYMRAFDISEHYRENWQGTGFKAQLVAPSKATALQYHAFLNEIGAVSSEVLISPPDTREGYEETDAEPSDEVVKFWARMMKRYGSEEEYTKQIINQFKFGGDPEIIIVVSKLLTGFDAPKNTILYICKTLKDLSLLQAIARVNRLHEGKEFGYVIDYVGLLGELDKALTLYSAFEGFDEADLLGTLLSIDREIAKLAQQYSDLWELFKTVKNSADEEAYEVFLADDGVREEFYLRLTQFSKTLAIALSSARFLAQTDSALVQRYKIDLRRFQLLKASVRHRYAESVDYREFEPKIKKLLDTHIQANEVIQLHDPVNIFDPEMFLKVKEEQGVYGTPQSSAAKADAIAHATRRAIHEKMEEDPVFYEKFSKLIQAVIEDFRAKRFSDLEYLTKVMEIKDKVVRNVHDDVPECIRDNVDAMAFFGIVRSSLEGNGESGERLNSLAAQTALIVQKILQSHQKVHFWDDHDAQKRVVDEIDDYLYDVVKKREGVPLSVYQMDELIEKLLQLALHRSNR
jgi:type I restriction enzyme R subunit